MIEEEEDRFLNENDDGESDRRDFIDYDVRECNAVDDEGVQTDFSNTFEDGADIFCDGIIQTNNGSKLYYDFVENRWMTFK